MKKIIKECLDDISPKIYNSIIWDFLKKQITYWLRKQTTYLYFGTATYFGRFRPSSGCQYNIAMKG